VVDVKRSGVVVVDFDVDEGIKTCEVGLELNNVPGAICVLVVVVSSCSRGPLDRTLPLERRD